MKVRHTGSCPPHRPLGHPSRAYPRSWWWLPRVSGRQGLSFLNRPNGSLSTTELMAQPVKHTFHHSSLQFPGAALSEAAWLTRCSPPVAFAVGLVHRMQGHFMTGGGDSPLPQCREGCRSSLRCQQPKQKIIINQALKKKLIQNKHSFIIEVNKKGLILKFWMPFTKQKLEGKEQRRRVQQSKLKSEFGFFFCKTFCVFFFK